MTLKREKECQGETESSSDNVKRTETRETVTETNKQKNGHSE